MSNLPTIVALTGRKRNGKDTIAEHLIKEYGYRQLAYAEPIKQICKILFDFSDEQCYGNLKEVVDERWGVTPRHCFEYIGTEMFRKQMGPLLPNIGENFWVVSLHNKIKKLIKSDPTVKIVISDVRFENELVEICKMAQELEVSTVSIRVTRPSINVNINKEKEHASEKAIDTLNVDYDLLNDSTKQSLYDKVTHVLVNN
jgi:hypothetical protein